MTKNSAKLRADFCHLVEVVMAHNEDFKDSTSFFHLLIALIALVAAPLLPTVMGWFTLLR